MSLQAMWGVKYEKTYFDVCVFTHAPSNRNQNSLEDIDAALQQHSLSYETDHVVLDLLLVSALDSSSRALVLSCSIPHALDDIFSSFLGLHNMD